jgi:hypothetical protein
MDQARINPKSQRIGLVKEKYEERAWNGSSKRHACMHEEREPFDAEGESYGARQRPQSTSRH